MRQHDIFWYNIISKLKSAYGLYVERLLPRKKSSRMYVIAGSGIFAIIIGISVIFGGSSSDSKARQMGTFAVRQGDLTISVTQSGSIKARNAVYIKSEVEGDATIISIVPDGTYIKTEDVNNKVLVELDSADLRERCTQQEITFASSKSSYTEANEAYHIQQNQNESDISTDNLSLQFALIDLQKYLGETVAAKLLGYSQNNADPNCDIASLVDDTNLGGDALQKLRDANSAISLADAQLKQAQSKLGWTQKLFEKKYVSGEDLERDQLDEKRTNVELDKTKTAIDLFRRYEFPKQTRKLFSDYIEAGRKLNRTQAQARSKLAQAEAKLASAKATYDLQTERLNKIKKQLLACIIKAPAAGLVVYETSSRRYGGSRGMIEAGATVHERQTIMSLPNTAEMSVDIKVHESSVDKVRPGQFAEITIDAFPDQTFTGRVIKVAPLPDQQDFFLNPDLKVYASEISIDGTHDFLKPGMSAKVEIIVNELKDVAYVPVQAVCTQGGKKVCYLAGDSPQPVSVTPGAFNDNFVEIVEGLSIGQLVLLNPPTMAQSEKTSDKQAPRPDASPKPAEMKKVAARDAVAAPAGK